jgi:hypothetical protein
MALSPESVSREGKGIYTVRVSHIVPGLGIGIKFTKTSESNLDQIRRFLETLSPFASKAMRPITLSEFVIFRPCVLFNHCHAPFMLALPPKVLDRTVDSALLCALTYRCNKLRVDAEGHSNAPFRRE